MFNIVLIGPGLKPIPSEGWGAVEIIVWEYYQELTKRGHICFIVNEPTPSHILKSISELQVKNKIDVVHVMYDDHISIVDKIQGVQLLLYTSHYAYLQDESFMTTGYRGIFESVIRSQNIQNLHVFAISESIRDVYIKYGFPSERIHVMHNGASERFRITEYPTNYGRTAMVGKIEMRKKQYVYQHIPSIDFIGNYADSPFDRDSPQYLGEWTRDELETKLTNYGNLCLLSDGEADPLVVKEALLSGLGVVCSECASANIDTSKEFVEVIPNNKLHDLKYIEHVLDDNRQKSLSLRRDIKEYANVFSWPSVITKYQTLVNSLLEMENAVDKYDITLVTTYYKFPSKHSVDNYDNWMRNLLCNLNAPLVIYTDKGNFEKIRSYRKEYETMTKIVVMEFSDLLMNNYDDMWKKHHNKDCEKDIHNINLYKIWNEKFSFMYNAMQSDYFKTQYFMWTDIGCFRNRQGCDDFDPVKLRDGKWPCPKKFKATQCHKKITFVNTGNFDPDRFTV